MSFQIFRVAPWHCPLTDGLVGSKVFPLPMVYSNQRLAEKLAGRLSDAEYEGCGDDHFVAAPVGQGPASRRSAFYDEIHYD